MIENAELSIHTGEWTVQKKAKKSKNASHVWDHIYEIHSAEKKVENLFYCTLCNKVMYNNYSSGNTNAFLRHVCSKQEDGKSRLIIRPDSKKDLKNASCNFIAKDLRPYSALEGEGLLELCNACMKFGQNYKQATSDDLRSALPSRNTVNSEISRRAIEVKNQIKSVLATAISVGGFAVTSDTWTDKYRGYTYICLVAHCNIITDKGIERHRFNLHTDRITELVKSKQVIVKYILEVLGEYGFNEAQVKEFITFVTDRGTNFKYGLLSNGYVRHNCYCHLINNLVKYMAKNSSHAKSIVENAAKVTAYVKKSSVNHQLEKTLKSFSRTRWNGIQMMLEAIAQNFDKLHGLLYERQRANPKLTCFDEISSLKCDEIVAISNFLKEFKGVSDFLEGETYETLSLVWPIYAQIWISLQPFDDDGERPKMIVEEMKREGLQYFLKNDKDFKPNIRHKLATVLNPQFKRLPKVLENERTDIYDQIKLMLNTNQVAEQETHQPEKSIEEKLQKVHPFLRSFCSFSPATPITPRTEFQEYLDEDVTDTIANVTDWWNQNKDKYPQLFKLFAKVSCIPATSSSGERVFSQTGLIVTSVRNKILPKNVNNIIIVNNLKKKH